LNWTNNNCESLNNILKLSTNWKILKLPDLIEKMHSIVKLQYADMRRALHGHGNYELPPKLKHLVLPNTIWMTKNEDERKKHFQKFLAATAIMSMNIKILLRFHLTFRIAKKGQCIYWYTCTISECTVYSNMFNAVTACRINKTKWT
jgi:hypothetical protein